MKINILRIVFILLLGVGSLIQISLLKPTRGQAMSMPFLITLAVFPILCIVYATILIIDKSLNKKLYRYIIIMAQIGVMSYTIKKYLFYDEFINNWDKEKFESMSDLYPPGDENYWVIALFTLILFGYSQYRIIKHPERHTDVQI